MIWASDFSQSVHRKGPRNRNPYRAAACACKFKYGGIVRGMVFLKTEYIRREFTPVLLCIFYSRSTLGAGFVLPNGISVLLSKGLCNPFQCYRAHEQFVVPVTGCSPWDDDFVALRCQAGQHALALGHVQVVDDRGLIHFQLDQINWCYICHGKAQCILAEQRNGIYFF